MSESVNRLSAALAERYRNVSVPERGKTVGGRRMISSLTSAVIFAGFSPIVAGAAAQDAIHLRVLTTHDLHGAVTPITYQWSAGRLVGGLPTVKAVMDSAEAECACPTLRLDGGDQMQGTLESNLVFGASMIEGLNFLGLDAAAIGNHELDWGVDTLASRLEQADYPWLAANVFEHTTGERPSWAMPFAILEEQGVRVGVIGYLTSATQQILVSDLSNRFAFLKGPSAIRDAVEAVRNEQPDFVIVVAHAPGDCDDTGRCWGEMVELASEIDSGSVDLIVAGHTHAPGQAVVRNVPIVRAGSNGRAVGVVDLVRRGRDTEFTIRIDTSYVDEVAPDAAMLSLMAPYQARADSLSGRRVATLGAPLRRQGFEYGLGRLMADAIRHTAESDVAFTNRGGIRADLPAGAVTYGEMYRVMPFGNTVYRLNVTGAELRSVVEHALRNERPEFFSGIRIEYDPALPAGERVRSMELADGSLVEAAGTYTLGTLNFLAEGGGGYSMLTDIVPERLGVLGLDAMIAYMQGLPQPVNAPNNERVRPLRN